MSTPRPRAGGTPTGFASPIEGEHDLFGFPPEGYAADPDDVLRIVARGEKEDRPAAVVG